MSTVCVAEVKTINLSLLLVWFAETGKLKALFLFDSYCWTSSEQVWFVQSLLGTPWRPSGQDSRLSLPKVQVHSLVGELRFCKPCGMAKKKKKKPMHLWGRRCLLAPCVAENVGAQRGWRTWAKEKPKSAWLVLQLRPPEGSGRCLCFTPSIFLSVWLPGYLS